MLVSYLSNHLKTSQEFRTLLLAKFTKELIKNSETAEAKAIKQKLRERIKENIEKKEEERKFMQIIEKKEIIRELEQIPLREKIKEKRKPFFYQKIKQIRDQMPETIKNILPIPTSEQLDLGKLNPLITDPTINLIECEAPNTYITIRRLKNETRTINIKLTEKEIEEIIRKFSGASKIPFEKGAFRAAFGRWIISAVISDVTSSSFVITKMMPFQNYET